MGRRARRIHTSDTDIENDEADATPERGPFRRCIATRVRGRREAMLRFVVSPDNVIVPDLAARLPGRGLWLSASRDVIDTARTKGAFARASRRKVTVPSDLVAIIETALTRRVGEHLGFARRAGQAVCGFVRARELIGSGRCGLVVQARDGSPEERRRLVGADGTLRVVAPLGATELGAVFGRDHIVHVAVTAGGLADAIAVEAERLAGIRGRDQDDAGDDLRQAGA